jgi:6-phosphogluconolactonase
LTERQTISTLPKELKGTSYCADVRVTPDGRYLYGMNRGHDSIAAYKVGEDGRLTSAGEPVKQPSPSCLMLLP